MITTYNDKILTEVLREFLEEGTIPTADMLLEAYETKTASHPDMTKPFILDYDWSIERYEDSSASTYNLLFERLQGDLEAVYTEVWDRMADGMESFDRWRIEIERLKKNLLDLETRIDGLLLLRHDTAGYFAFVEDNFVDMSKVDQTQTTANVDIIAHTVTLNEDLSAGNPQDLNDILSTDATFTILTREYVLSSKEAPGASVVYALQDVARSWQHRIRATVADKPITGELKVKLGDSSVEVSKILMQLHSSNACSAVIITGMYSLDNYNWYNLPTDSYTQSADEQALFIFPPIQMQWVKFIMTKTGADDYDNGQYIYEFGASSLKFYATGGYTSTTGNLLVSKELSAYDSDDNRIQFNKVTLQTCQELPEDTDIQYYVIAKNDDAETGALRIDPFTLAEPRRTTVIDFGKTLEIEEMDLALVTKSDSESIDFFSSYADLLESDLLALVGTDANTVFYISADEAIRMLENQITFYRNIGDSPAETNQLVRDTSRGWQYDETNTYLTTKIIVNNLDGLTADFGNSSILIDGQEKRNVVNIPQGTHTIRIHARNAADLIYNNSPYSSETDLVDDDPLYPYNHKAIIEGVTYTSDYVEEKKYLGVDLYCEHIANRVSVFDLLYNTAENDYSKFAIDTIADGRRVLVVKFDPSDANASNEKFALKYVTGDSMFDRVIFKAELVSTFDDRTPVLTAWRLKLGA